MTRILHTTFLLFVTLLISNAATSPSIINVEGRKTTTLNGKWNYIIDMYETGYYDYRYNAYDERSKITGGFSLDQTARNKQDLIEYSFDASPTLWVPGDWNSQDDRLLYYEGSIWYRKKFDYTKKESNNRVFIHFGAANYETDVYINGKKLGKHIGGFTPFQYEITDFLKESGNSVVVKVDNKRKRDAVPTINSDWWNYGGITRDVTIVELPETYISDYSIYLNKESKNNISGTINLNGKILTDDVKVSIPELKIEKTFKTSENGDISFSFNYKKITKWSPKNPKLYTVTFSSSTDKVSEEIGFRTIETRGTDILLNGESVFLSGICIHEENALRGGRAYSKEDALMLLTQAKELGCNYVRLAHYPHSENMVRLADKMGLMIWEENPVYWTIMWENPDTYNNADQQLTDMIERDKNRASIIIWSMANETPVSDARNIFLKNLAAKARSLDPTRLISAAMEVHDSKTDRHTKIVEDPFADYVDIINFNQYNGWYGGTPASCDNIKWEIKYNKPVMISEFGGGALQGFHGDTLTRWSEEYQESLYKHTLPMLEKIPQFRGVTPWILYDFRSPRRLLPNIQDGWNRKGIISENGIKKKAYFVLQEFYKQKSTK